jgi:GNAT superfamily N-acetyltransferase
MPTLKQATIEDNDNVLAMVKEYAYTSPYKDKVNKEALELLVKEFLVEKDKVVFYVVQDNLPIGFIAGAAVPFILGLDTIATEFAWWVHPDFRLNGVGLRLIDAFEAWAKEEGCSMVALSSTDEGTGEVYTKRGYSLAEHTYMKTVCQEISGFGVCL